MWRQAGCVALNRQVSAAGVTTMPGWRRCAASVKSQRVAGTPSVIATARKATALPEHDHRGRHRCSIGNFQALGVFDLANFTPQ